MKMKIKAELIKIIKEYIPQPSAYRVFVLWGAPLSSKTELALELAKEFDGKYIDLLEDKLSSLKPKIGLYSPTDFKRDACQWIKGCISLLVIDEIEPLSDTWTKQDKENFFKLMARWRTNCVVLIVSELELPYEDLIGKERLFKLEV